MVGRSRPPQTASERDDSTTIDAVIVGGGVIGLACAWRAAQRGLGVCVLERDRAGRAATGVAAGMLAPVGEATWGEESLLALGLASLRAGRASRPSSRPRAREPAVRRWARCTSPSTATRPRSCAAGTSCTASSGLESEWLRPGGCRDSSRAWRPRSRRGPRPGEASADPGRLTAALLAALERRGVRGASRAPRWSRPSRRRMGG